MDSSHPNQIIVRNITYTYAITHVPVTNALGFTRAVLREYTITTGAGAEQYKIYKTSEGRWYDMHDPDLYEDKYLLIAFKQAIDNKESGV